MEKQKALIADDSDLICGLINSALETIGFEQNIVVSDGKQAISAYESNDIDITFLDLDMPVMNGLTTLSQIKNINPEAYVVIVSGGGTAANVKNAIALGAKGFIAKPCDQEKISQAINKFRAEKVEPYS